MSYGSDKKPIRSCPHCRLKLKQSEDHYCRVIARFVLSKELLSYLPSQPNPSPTPPESAQVFLKDGSSYSFDNLKQDKVLGRGSFGVVLLCREPQSKKEMAVKMPFELGDSGLVSLQKERDIMNTLVHPNVRALWGEMKAKGEFKGLVLEYLPASLYDLIYSHLSAAIPLANSEKLVRGVIEGIKYLHGQRIIHRDIKPGNILLGADGNAKIGDLGNARRSDGDNTYYSNYCSTTLRYAAPNLLMIFRDPSSHKKIYYSFDTDWYAVAMTIWEIYARKIPFSELKESEQEKKRLVHAVIDQNRRPTISPDLPFELIEPIQQAWANKLNSASSFSSPDLLFSAESYFCTGKEKAKVRDYKGAIPYYNRAIELNSFYAEAFHARGVAYYYTAQHVLEMQDYNQAVFLKPNFAQAYFDRGFLKNKNGDFAGALTDYDTALRFNPFHSEALSCRLRLQAVLVQKQEQALQEAVSRLYLEAEKKREERGYKEAIQYYTKIIELKNNEAKAYRDRGNSYYLLGSYREAAADYTEALSLASMDFLAVVYQGILQEIWIEPACDFKEDRPPLSLSNSNSAASSPSRSSPISASLLASVSNSGPEPVILWSVYYYDQNTPYISHVALSRNGEWLVSYSRFSSIIQLYSFKTKKNREVPLLDLKEGEVYSVLLNATGAHALIAHHDKILRYWDLQNGVMLKEMHGHEKAASSLAFLPLQNYCLSGSYDKTVRLWDLDTGNELQIMRGHTHAVNSVAMSADGRFALSGSTDKTMRLWNLLTGELIRTFVGHTESITSVAFRVGREGCFLISASMDKTINIWNPETGQILKTLRGHEQGITSIVCSIDGRFIISASLDNTIRLWGFRTGTEISVFRQEGCGIGSVALSEDGSFMVSSSSRNDKLVRYWDLQYYNLLGKTPNNECSHDFSPVFDMKFLPSQPSKKERCVLL